MMTTFDKLPLRPMPPERPESIQDLIRYLVATGACAVPVARESGGFDSFSTQAALRATDEGITDFPSLTEDNIHVVEGTTLVSNHLIGETINKNVVFVISQGNRTVGWITALEALAYIGTSLLPRVAEFMVTNRHVCLHSRELIHSALKELLGQRCRFVLVLDDDGRTSATLTDTDIGRLIEEGCDIWHTLLGDKARPAVTITESALLRDAYTACTEARAPLLVVTNTRGEPLGTLTMEEITRSFAAHSLKITGAQIMPVDDPEHRANETMFLDTVLNNSLRTGIVGTDEYLNIICFNETITNFVQEPSTLRLGGDIWGVIDACAISRKSFKSALDNAKRSGEQVITNWVLIKEQRRYVQCRLRTVARKDDVAGFVLSVQDMTAQRNAEDAIRKLAYQDRLTQLPNRLLFEERLDGEIKRAKRHDTRFAIMMMDLNGFKAVNDDFGHTTGDELLCLLGQRLEAAIRESDTVARFGGDEFVFILPEIAHVEDVEKLAEKMRGVIRQPCVIDDRDMDIDAAIGFSIYPDDSIHSKELLDLADARMYKNKRQKD